MALAMPRIRLIRRLVDKAWVHPEALNVTPDLLGAPLAPHRRRALAIGVDVVVVALFSSSPAFWVAAGIVALISQLRRPRPGLSRWHRLWMWPAFGLLVLVAAQHTTSFVERRFDPARAAASSDADADLDEADDAVALQAPRTATVPSPPSAAGSGAQDIASQREQAAALREARLAARVEKLESELADARKARPVHLRDDFLLKAHAAGLGFGLALAYFTLLPYWWKGQTIGKRLFGLRVVELTGKPLTLMTCFGRYGGYAAGMATGGAGFAQVLWDCNRQAIQDKLAHTVVLDLREPRATRIPIPVSVPAPRSASIEPALGDSPRRDAA